MRYSFLEFFLVSLFPLGCLMIKVSGLVSVLVLVCSFPTALLVDLSWSTWCGIMVWLVYIGGLMVLFLFFCAKIFNLSFVISAGVMGESCASASSCWLILFSGGCSTRCCNKMGGDISVWSEEDVEKVFLELLEVSRLDGGNKGLDDVFDLLKKVIGEDKESVDKFCKALIFRCIEHEYEALGLMKMCSLFIKKVEADMKK